MQKHHLAELICKYSNKHHKNPELLFVSKGDLISLEQFSILRGSPLARDCKHQSNINFFGAIVLEVDDPCFQAKCLMVDDVEYAIKNNFTYIRKYLLTEPLQGYVNEDSPLDKEVDYIDEYVPNVVKNAYIKNIGSR